MRNTFLLLLLLVGTTAFAQQKLEALEAYKVGVFTKELQLTTEESKVFWPLYNKMEEELKDIRRKLAVRPKQLEFASDEEAKELIRQQFGWQEERIKIQRRYYEEMMQVLPVRKVAAIPKAEQNYKKALLERVRERRGGNRVFDRG